MIPNRVAMEQWCVKNISPIAYYMPTSKGVRHGGVGWELTAVGSHISVRIDDEKTLVLFLLLFSQPGVSVSNETISVGLQRY